MTNKLTHYQKMDRLRSLYIKHCERFGRLSYERYLGVLDGLDLATELNESIKTFENDLRNVKNIPSTNNMKGGYYGIKQQADSEDT